MKMWYVASLTWLVVIGEADGRRVRKEIYPIPPIHGSQGGRGVANTPLTVAFNDTVSEPGFRKSRGIGEWAPLWKLYDPADDPEHVQNLIDYKVQTILSEEASLVANASGLPDIISRFKRLRFANRETQFHYDRGEDAPLFKFFSVDISQKVMTAETDTWCERGVLGAINNALVRVMSSKSINFKKTTSLKNLYFQSSNSLGAGSFNVTQDEWLTLFESGGIPKDSRRFLLEVESSSGVLDDLLNDSADAISLPETMLSALPIESMFAVGKIFPVFMDLLSGSSNATTGQKMESFANKFCTMSDAEYAVSGQPSPSGGEDATPWTCLVVDLIGAVLACSTRPFTFASVCSLGDMMQGSDEDTIPEEDIDILQQVIPDHTLCVASEYAMQKTAVPGAFRFSDPTVQLELSMCDIFHETRRRRLPDEIPHSVFLREQLTYLALYRAIMLSYKLMKIPRSCGHGSMAEMQLVPGWSLDFVVAGVEESDPSFALKDADENSLPLFYVSRNVNEACEFLIIIRGTATLFEWHSDFHYWLRPFPYSQNSGAVLVHAGYFNIMAKVVPLIEAHLVSELEFSKCGCQKTRLIVSGHSLGAGIGQLVALYFAERYHSHKKYGCGLRVDGVFFAPPRVLSKGAVRRISHLVNMRVIIDINDPLAYAPCYEGNSRLGIPRCSKGHIFSPGIGRDLYSENPALIKINVPYSPKDKELVRTSEGLLTSISLSNTLQAFGPLIGPLFHTIAKSAVFQALPSYDDMSSAHVCSFACLLSKNACHGTTDNLQYPDQELFSWWCNDCPTNQLQFRF